MTATALILSVVLLGAPPMDYAELLDRMDQLEAQVAALEEENTELRQLVYEGADSKPRGATVVIRLEHFEKRKPNAAGQKILREARDSYAFAEQQSRQMRHTAALHPTPQYDQAADAAALEMKKAKERMFAAEMKYGHTYDMRGYDGIGRVDVFSLVSLTPEQARSIKLGDYVELTGRWDRMIGNRPRFEGYVALAIKKPTLFRDRPLGERPSWVPYRPSDAERSPLRRRLPPGYKP